LFHAEASHSAIISLKNKPIVPYFDGEEEIRAMIRKNYAMIFMLTMIATFVLLTNQTYAGFVEKGLVSYYSFNDVNGEEVIDDWGPNNGVLEGPVLPKAATGKYGDALRFNGQDSRVNCGNDESLDITKALSIEAWVYMEIRGSYPTIVGKSGSNWGYIFEFLTDTGKINLYLDGANPSWANVASTSVKLEEWAHIAATYDGKTVRYYFNGDPDGDYPATANAILSNQDNVHIGMRKVGEPHFFTGIIDEVRIYNRALEAAEVKVNMNAEGAAVNPVDAAAVTWGRIKYSN